MFGEDTTAELALGLLETFATKPAGDLLRPETRGAPCHWALIAAGTLWYNRLLRRCTAGVNGTEVMTVAAEAASTIGRFSADDRVLAAEAASALIDPTRGATHVPPPAHGQIAVLAHVEDWGLAVGDDTFGLS